MMGGLGQPVKLSHGMHSGDVDDWHHERGGQKQSILKGASINGTLFVHGM